MASSNIKLFDENKGNMLSDSEFNSSTQRMNGLQAGVASSKLQNKAMYQASLMAYAIAHVMMQNGKNANDTDAVSAFVANLSGTMLQKVYDVATTEEAQAGVATGKWMSPALVKAAIDKLAAQVVYPVGSIYMSVNNTNPSTFFGGTWERLKDRFLLAAGDTYAAGSTGGEATHTLTISEMPRHTHSSKAPIYARNGGNPSMYSGVGSSYPDVVDYTGGGQAHNNMPPYLAVYVWKRIA